MPVVPAIFVCSRYLAACLHRLLVSHDRPTADDFHQAKSDFNTSRDQRRIQSNCPFEIRDDLGVVGYQFVPFAWFSRSSPELEVLRLLRIQLDRPIEIGNRKMIDSVVGVKVAATSPVNEPIVIGCSVDSLGELRNRFVETIRR